jgi:TolB-like protein
MADPKDEKPKIAVLRDEEKHIVSDAELKKVQKSEGNGFMGMGVAIVLFVVVFGCAFVPLGLWMVFGGPPADTDGGKLAIMPVVWQGEGDGSATGPLGDELLADLSKEPTLEVSPLVATAKYKNDSRELAEIGKELGVKYLVQVAMVAGSEGSVTLEVSLSNVEKSQLVFSERFPGALADVSTTEDLVAKKIIEGTKVQAREPAASH